MLSQRSVIIIWIGLLFAFAILIIMADFVGPIVRSALLDVATEGFRITLPALVGALSVYYGTLK